MGKMLAIAGRELRSAFVTPLAYVLFASFMLISGFFFFTLVQGFNALLTQSAMIPDMHPSLNAWVIIPYYRSMQIVLLFLIPLISMRAFSEEKARGTFELLATSPLSLSQMVWGKFLGLGLILSIILGLSFIYPLVLIFFCDPEIPQILTGFFGLVLFSQGFLALGVGISACTKSPLISSVLSIVVFLLLFIIDAPAENLGEPFKTLLLKLSPAKHSEVLLQGLVSSEDLVYFLSLILLGLFIARRALEREKWR